MKIMRFENYILVCFLELMEEIVEKLNDKGSKIRTAFVNGKMAPLSTFYF